MKRELDLARESSSDPDSDSTTGDSCGIDSTDMTKAALYARVTTDAQKQEGIIKSQVLEARGSFSACQFAPANRSRGGYEERKKILSGP